jgi:uncharacterized repeat protein (TIGR03803 family)
MGGLIASGDTLYGTCSSGGLYGFGTVFSLKTNGSQLTVLKHFAGTPDGKDPYSELLLVSNMLYGTTAAGGSFGKGTVFKIDIDTLQFSIIKSFAGSDGLLPLGPLTWSDGVLYGTTESGGTWTNGTVFSLLPDGGNFATLKEFDGQQASGPRYSLVVSGGWIYGTTEGDPLPSLVYQLSTDGSQYNVLKTFSPVDPVTYTNVDGNGTQSGLVASGGTLFGSTRSGGNYASGVLFALQMNGSGYTVLKHFSATTNNGATGYYPNSDGAAPGRLSLAGSILFGLTKYGGTVGAGTLVSLDIAPRIQLLSPSSGAGPNGFSFDVMGFSNQLISVQASAGLTPASWLPLSTNMIGGGLLRFTDSDATNYSRRFYRIQAQ